LISDFLHYSYGNYFWFFYCFKKNLWICLLYTSCKPIIISVKLS
jgi:hypothetical protein